MNLVHRYSEIEYYAETIRSNLPPHLWRRPVPQRAEPLRDLRHQSQRKHPDAETIELDATNADHYAFDEAVSPSLLSERSNRHRIRPAKRRRQADSAKPWSPTASKPSTIQPKPASSSANMKAASKVNDSSTNSPKPEQSKKPWPTSKKPTQNSTSPYNASNDATDASNPWPRGRTRRRARRRNRRTRSHGRPTLLRLRRQSHNIGTRQPIPHRQPPSRRLPRGRPRTLRTLSRRHHRHADFGRTRHRANRTHRSATP